MRLWHKDLICVLPRKQLLGQWRECCLIAKNIKEKGILNHILVNKIMDYPIEDFIGYAMLVYLEMRKRGYDANLYKVTKYIDTKNVYYDQRYIFLNWHNERYLRQCFYNLQEKYDCRGITEKEWVLIEQMYEHICIGDYW